MRNMVDGDTFCELTTTIIIFTKILQSSLKTSSCKPQALLMFNIMKYVFAKCHKKLFDRMLFFYTCSQEIVNSFTHFHCRPPRVKFAALIEKLPLHYIQLWDTTQT